MPEFLDGFYQAHNALEQSESLQNEPALTGDMQVDALLAAICEYLAKQHALPNVPHWVSGPARFLKDPWFTNVVGGDAMREYLAFASPATTTSSRKRSRYGGQHSGKTQKAQPSLKARDRPGPNQ